MGIPDSSRKQVPPKTALRCGICDKPVAIETAKTDAAGNAMHEECNAVKVKLEQASQDGHHDATRPWKVIAAEVSREPDSKKVTDLVEELNQALEEQNLDGTPKPKPTGKPRPESQ